MRIYIREPTRSPDSSHDAVAFARRISSTSNRRNVLLPTHLSTRRQLATNKSEERGETRRRVERQHNGAFIGIQTHSFHVIFHRLSAQLLYVARNASRRSSSRRSCARIQFLPRVASPDRSCAEIQSTVYIFEIARQFSTRFIVEGKTTRNTRRKRATLSRAQPMERTLQQNNKGTVPDINNLIN